MKKVVSSSLLSPKAIFYPIEHALPSIGTWKQAPEASGEAAVYQEIAFKVRKNASYHFSHGDTFMPQKWNLCSCGSGLAENSRKAVKNREGDTSPTRNCVISQRVHVPWKLHLNIEMVCGIHWLKHIVPQRIGATAELICSSYDLPQVNSPKNCSTTTRTEARCWFSARLSIPIW